MSTGVQLLKNKSQSGSAWKGVLIPQRIRVEQEVWIIKSNLYFTMLRMCTQELHFINLYRNFSSRIFAKYQNSIDLCFILCYFCRGKENKFDTLCYSSTFHFCIQRIFHSYSTYNTAAAAVAIKFPLKLKLLRQRCYLLNSKAHPEICDKKREIAFKIKKKWKFIWQTLRHICEKKTRKKNFQEPIFEAIKAWIMSIGVESALGLWYLMSRLLSANLSLR